MATRNLFLAKSSYLRWRHTHSNQETSTFHKANDLSDAHDTNYNQIKLEDQTSFMNMLRDCLEYAFNTQSQIYLEIKACESIRTRYEYSIYHTKI